MYLRFLYKITTRYSYLTTKYSYTTIKCRFFAKKEDDMKRLTGKEEEIMDYYWEKGPMFVKELMDFYEDPKPHFNTLSTIVRSLEEKGFLAHKTFGNTYQYYSIVTKEAYRDGALKNVIIKYFDNSFHNVISALVKEEDISTSELKQIIEEVEKEQFDK